MEYRRFSLKSVFVLSLFVSLSAFIAACGGGGGPSYPNLSYTGVQAQAVITQDNAADFPFAILAGSGDSTTIPLAANIQIQNSGGLPDTEIVKKASQVIASKVKEQLANTSLDLVTGATQSYNGSCGGKITVSDSDTGSSFSGSVTFENYCEGGMSTYGYELRMHGRMHFSGTYYLDASNLPVITSMQMDIEYLKLAYQDAVTNESEEFSGSMTVNFDVDGFPSDIILTVNYKYEDKIYKIANFQIDEVAGTISATFYHPDYGYVDVVTITPFIYNYSTEQFCSGKLQITGNDGLGNSVAIEFTDYSCTTYDLCITDTSGTVCSLGNDWGTVPVWPVP